MKYFLVVLAFLGLALGRFLPQEPSCLCCEPNASASCCGEDSPSQSPCDCEMRKAPEPTEKINACPTLQIPSLEFFATALERTWTLHTEEAQPALQTSDQSPPPIYLTLLNLRI